MATPPKNQLLAGPEGRISGRTEGHPAPSRKNALVPGQLTVGRVASWGLGTGFEKHPDGMSFENTLLKNLVKSIAAPALALALLAFAAPAFADPTPPKAPSATGVRLPVRATKAAATERVDAPARDDHESRELALAIRAQERKTEPLATKVDAFIQRGGMRDYVVDRQDMPAFKSAHVRRVQDRARDERMRDEYQRELAQLVKEGKFDDGLKVELGKKESDDRFEDRKAKRDEHDRSNGSNAADQERQKDRVREQMDDRLGQRREEQRGARHDDREDARRELKDEKDKKDERTKDRADEHKESKDEVKKEAKDERLNDRRDERQREQADERRSGVGATAPVR